jgi:hypothetical protein
MNKPKTPASGNRGRELDNDFGESQFIKHPTKHTPRNRQQVLEEIAQKWASCGLYKSPARAMIALLEGVQ